ncbi:hypothetical protein [Rickettsiales endosymbiont of Stachyamoeba lipophora]|nr:hypothetical protein [Rickettsiales endosymbiont of Stachyamoeba lipophora]
MKPLSLDRMIKYNAEEKLYDFGNDHITSYMESNLKESNFNSTHLT